MDSFKWKHSWPILQVFLVNCSAHGDSVYTPLFISSPTQHPEMIAAAFFIYHLVGFASVGNLVLKQYTESICHSWFRQEETLTLSSKKFANKFPAAQVRPDFSVASIRIAKFHWLTLQPGSLFPGETEERLFPLFLSVDQTTWRSAGRWELCKSHILLSSISYKLFIWSQKTAVKSNAYWQVLWLSSFFFIRSW